MTAKIVLALICQVALASECSSEDSQCDASVLLQGQKKVEAHVRRDFQASLKNFPIHDLAFTVNPSDFDENVGLTIEVVDAGTTINNGTLLVFVGNSPPKLQGIQNISTFFPPTQKQLYDVMVHGHGQITSSTPGGQTTTTAGDDGKPLTFSYLTGDGRLVRLKPVGTAANVFKANARGCEVQGDGSVRSMNHFTPLVLNVVRECMDSDATADKMKEFMTSTFGIGYASFTCAQMKGWNACSHVPGVCDVTCVCKE